MTWAPGVICAILTCKEPIYITKERQAELRKSNATFHCIWGHTNWYPGGGSEADKLRQERDRLKQEAARKDEEIVRERRWRSQAEQAQQAAERRVSAAKGRITRMKKREAEGVCPCCDSKFVNLAQHMKSKHPEHGTEDVVMEEVET